MKITQLIIFCIVAYFLFFKKEGYNYIELPSTCSKEDPGLMCKNRRGINISLTPSSTKDCNEKNPEVQCKDSMGIYKKISQDQSKKIINDFMSQVKTDIQPPQIQRGDATCDTVNPSYSCDIKGRRTTVFPANVQDCKRGSLECRNNMGTFTTLTKEQSDKVIKDFMSQNKTDIQQPQIQRGDATCDTVNPSYSCDIKGRRTTVFPANVQDCKRGSLECRNNMGTFTTLTKEQGDKVIKDFMSQVKTDIQQPIFDEEYSKKARRCKIPLETKRIGGNTYCKNDLDIAPSWISMPKPTTSPSQYITLSEL